MADAPQGLRNLGIVAHIDAGKTTLTEQLLALTGMVRYAGAVEDGSTVTDWQRQEQERGITIGSAAVTCRWRGAEITIVDTPGHVDFSMEVERSLRVIDSGVVVLSGPEGVQAQTETVWHQAAERGLPVVGFVNKLDRPGFDDAALQAHIRQRLGIEPLPLQVPVEHGDAQSIALIDVLDGVLLRWRGVGTKQAARAPARSSLTEEQELERQIALERIVDAVASHDDDFAVAVLSGAAVAPEDYLRALRQAVAARACLPLLYGAARAGVGVAAVADAIVALLPEPDGGASQHCYDRASGSLLPALAAPAPGTPAAFVFKTERRRGGARLAYVRVFAGALASDARLVRLPGGAPWRARQLVRLMGGSEEPVARLEAGMIGGLLDDDPEQLPITGETLAAPGYGCAFERLDPPAPVIAVAVEAPDLEHDRAMREALRALIADDSSLRVTVDPESGQTLLAGMGELHLELTVERLIEAVGVPLAVGSPRPQRRRILASTAAGAGQHDAGTIPAERVEIALIVRPITGGVGHVIRYAGEPPRRPQWREALEAGIHAGLAADRRDPVDVIGVEVSVERVAVTAAEPAPVAFRDAGLAATQQAVLAARPVLAEPWMLLTVVIPDEHVGRVVGDLSRRRARVRSSEQRGPLQVLTVDGPLDGLIGYATALRTLTSGRGIFTMQPAGYLAV